MFFFAALPEIFGTVNHHVLSFIPQFSASLIPCDPFFSQEVSILSGAFSKTWLLPLDLFFSKLILVWAPIFSCQHYLCKPQVHISHSCLSLSSQPVFPSPAEQFHLLICFTLVLEAQQTTCQNHLLASKFTPPPEFSPSDTIISSLNHSYWKTHRHL